ncbi:DUF4865 family protein [Ralstonia insidiosa]|uniref:DUF4865 family protein n=1 Tax=Ralstonia insidiosa TaxID=190721 RepID=A0A848PAT2_9RALS|nr:DUF4865 family protein [Ralstonia insidiosa]NMV40638.1 DUF4865 family protein [Ralstonia insidiosa]
MLLAHYAHHLPADYDMARLHVRASQRGPLWDDAPALFFKAFLLREKGRFGATANEYSSLYLWQHDAAFRDFLVNGRYHVVTESFGRAAIRTHVALDARKGPSNTARFAYLEEKDIAPDGDLTDVFRHAIERNREAAAQAGTAAAVIGVDTVAWRLIGVRLSEAPPADNETATCHQLLHLAQPLLETLP